MVEQAGVPDGFRVVGGARGRVGHPDQPTVQVAGDLEVQAGAVVLARVQAGLVPPVPARHEGAVDDQLGVRGEPVGGWDVVFQDTGEQECPGGQDPRDGGLGDPGQFGEGLLVEVVTRTGENEPDALVEAWPS